MEAAVQLGDSIDLPGSATVLRDLAEAGGEPAGSRSVSSRELVAKLVDPVLEPCQLAERRAQPALLALEGVVHGEDQGGVAEREHERLLPALERGGSGLGGGQQRGLGRDPQGREHGFGDGEAHDQEHHQGPDRPTQGRQDLPESVHGERQEGVEGQHRGPGSALEADQERGARHPEAKREDDHHAQPGPARPRGERTRQCRNGQKRGRGECDMARS
jgi:hypothetical protein